ncbi:MAG: response regulator [Spirulinaceae cyanobacterium SM2_1_0]|nr:response regulator [Spirulinaceae cyanobacterium SM2_1_0]
MTDCPATLLIVDDELENLQVLSQALNQHGYKVRGAVKGELALRAVRSGQIDLILLDIRMPEINGYNLCHQLKADPTTAQIPIIFLSALDDTAEKVKAFQMGGVDYITKPFQIEEVLARVENQLTIQRLQRQLQSQNQHLQAEIQERRDAEDNAATAAQSKSLFLANMSHELRTPLNAILGFTQVLQHDRALDPEHREYINIISQSSKHLLELIDDILNLSKIEAGVVTYNERSCDLYQLLDGLEDMFQMKIIQKGIALHFQIDANVPKSIRTDPQKLRSCLTNLLGNAVKFTERGQIMVSASAQPPIHPGDPYQIHFAVSDTGYGIDADELEKMFAAFVQTASGRASAEGTGLGLSITKHFVELLGGAIAVESQRGMGTTFRFHISAQADDGSNPSFIKPHRTVLGLAPDQPTYRILVADDTREHRLLLVKLLSRLGFQVRQASNGQDALAIWHDWRPHLIWMDTRMPVMDGIAATGEIRAREVELAQAAERLGEPLPDYTVIITLSASAFEDQRMEILAAGSDDFIRKPYAEAAVLSKLVEHLGVVYAYEETETAAMDKPEPAETESTNPWQQRLNALPAIWRRDLARAAQGDDAGAVLALIETLPAQQAELAGILRELVRQSRLETLANVTARYLTPPPAAS